MPGVFLGGVEGNSYCLLLKAVPPALAAAWPLSGRRTLIVRHLAYGKSPGEIGRLLGIARESVYEHLAESRRQLQVRTNFELVRLAVQRGFLEP